MRKKRLYGKKYSQKFSRIQSWR